MATSELPPEAYVNGCLEIFNSEATPATALKLGSLLKQNDKMMVKNLLPISKMMVVKTLSVYLYMWLSSLLALTAAEKPMRQTRKWLYKMLREMAVYSVPFREQMTEAYVPELVAGDLANLQPEYTQHNVSNYTICLITHRSYSQ